MKILIDNGHGITTKGKRSVDGRLLEYKYCREIATEVCKRLSNAGYDADMIVPENADVSLGERANRVNAWCDRLGTKNVCLVSIHNDAQGMGNEWTNASGFSVRVSPNASEQSKVLAKLIYNEAEKFGKAVTGNRATPKDKYWVQSLYILNNTKCPAVLTENLFMTNRGDVEWLLSPCGRDAIVRLHVDGIKAYVSRYGKK